MKKKFKKCHKAKILEDYPKMINGLDGHRHVCKKCFNAQVKISTEKRLAPARKKKEEELKNKTHQVCVTCKENKSIKDFYIRKPPYKHKIRRHKLGIYIECKVCRNKRTTILTRKWQSDNRDKYNAYIRDWHKKNNLKKAA